MSHTYPQAGVIARQHAPSSIKRLLNPRRRVQLAHRHLDDVDASFAPHLDPRHASRARVDDQVVEPRKPAALPPPCKADTVTPDAPQRGRDERYGAHFRGAMPFSFAYFSAESS